MDMVNKYIQTFKDEITNRVENLTPILIKSLRYYGIYQIMSDYFDLIVNVLILIILLIIVREATYTPTTAYSRALLFVIVILNFAIVQLLYGSYYFLMVQLYFVMCLKQLIRLALFSISLVIY
jgi:heme A synthase